MFFYQIKDDSEYISLVIFPLYNRLYDLFNNYESPISLDEIIFKVISTDASYHRKACYSKEAGLLKFIHMNMSEEEKREMGKLLQAQYPSKSNNKKHSFV